MGGFGGSTKQVPNQTPYFQAIQELLAKDALGAKTPTMPGLFGTSGPGGQNYGGGGPGGTPYNSPISFAQGQPTGTRGTSGNSPASILMQMLNSFAPGGGAGVGAPGGSVGAAPSGTSGPGGVSLAVRPGAAAPPAPSGTGNWVLGDPGNVSATGPGFINQIFNPGSSIPQSDVPSLDNILQTETGANSAFTNTILPALTAQFKQANDLSMAGAKESAGNLTGSGFANTLGSAAGRSAATEGADISQILAQLAQGQAGIQNQDLLAQYAAQNAAQGQNADSFSRLMQLIFGGGSANTVSTPGWSSILPGLLGAGGQLGAAAITSSNKNNNNNSNYGG